jgi:DNA-binding PadR family transcriptional regulator
MKKNMQRDLFPGALEMMILRTLKLQPLHGYALAQHIKRTSNDLLQIEEGSLYPALQRMLKEGGTTADSRLRFGFRLTQASLRKTFSR